MIMPGTGLLPTFAFSVCVSGDVPNGISFNVLPFLESKAPQSGMLRLSQPSRRLSIETPTVSLIFLYSPPLETIRPDTDSTSEDFMIETLSKEEEP